MTITPACYEAPWRDDVQLPHQPWSSCSSIIHVGLSSTWNLLRCVAREMKKGQKKVQFSTSATDGAVNDDDEDTMNSNQQSADVKQVFWLNCCPLSMTVYISKCIQTQTLQGWQNVRCVFSLQIINCCLWFASPYLCNHLPQFWQLTWSCALSSCFTLSCT